MPLTFAPRPRPRSGSAHSGGHGGGSCGSQRRCAVSIEALLRLPSTKSGGGRRAADSTTEWGRDDAQAARLAVASQVQPVFPDSLGGWCDPSYVRRAWRQVRDEVRMDGLVSPMIRKTVTSFLDDADVSTRKINDQLGHAKVRMTQDRYLGRKLTDR